MSAEPVLCVRDLSHRFGALQALQGLDLEISAGEVVSLIGPNGSGKSTSLNLIAGALQIQQGRVFLDGSPVSGLPPEQIARRGIARTFQNGRVFGNTSILDNVLVGLAPRLRQLTPLAGLRRWPLLRWGSLLAEALVAIVQPQAVRKEEAGLLAAARAQLARFGERLLPRQDEPAYRFSYANRRRTEIARALVAQPRLLLLDEPTAGMNTTETAEVKNQLLALKAAGQTMLLVEHKLDLVMAVSDRVVVLDGGKVIAQGTPHQVRNDPLVIEAYLGHPRPSVPVPRHDHIPAPLLELKGVDVYYGAFQALQQVDLTVGQGEVVCLLGGNACGKSTTMKTILHLLRPRQGQVLIDGQDSNGWDSSSVVRAGIASVPEARRVFAEMSVEENLLMGAYTRRSRQEVAQTLEQQYQTFPRLAERRRQLAGTLSGGEQQMLAFGRALMSRPRLVCMDEPTMGLSPRLVDQVLEMIQRINGELGLAVLMVEQNAELALSIAHRGYVLQNGVVRLSGQASGLLTDPRIREAYLGEVPGQGAVNHFLR